MSSEKIYLITGANRGLGRGLVEALIQRPNTTVIAGVRDLSASSSTSLRTLSPAPGSKIIPVIINSSDPVSAKTAVETLQKEHSITKLDIVIANAGISNYYGTADITPIEEVREHFEVNTIGVLALYQATWPLLKLSASPIFVPVSTGAASIGDMGSVPLAVTAYGASKAAVNYITRKIHFENPSLTAFVISPGWVKTEMGNFGAASHGMPEAPVTIEDSVAGMLAKIDGATREATSGTFQSFDETAFKW